MRHIRNPLAVSFILASMVVGLAGCKDKLQSDIEQACKEKPQCIANATKLCSNKNNDCRDSDHIGMTLWRNNNHIPPQ